MTWAVPGCMRGALATTETASVTFHLPASPVAIALRALADSLIISVTRLPAVAFVDSRRRIVIVRGLTRLCGAGLEAITSLPLNGRLQAAAQRTWIFS